MKLLFLIVSLIAVFTANCRRFDGEPAEQQVNSELAKQAKGKTRLGASKIEDQDSSDFKAQFNKKDENENEIKLRGSKCAANAVCTILGGTCVTKSSPCTGRVVDDACKGKKSMCCIIERVSQCVNETTIQDTIKEGNDNITSVLESTIGNLESELQSLGSNLTDAITERVSQYVNETTIQVTIKEGNNNITSVLESTIGNLGDELQTMRSNLTDAITESKGHCVDESTMKDSINKGNDNITSVLESTIGNVQSDLQAMGSNLTDAITESVNQCVGETAMKEAVYEGNNNVTRALEIKINELESELQAIKNNVNNSIKGCPKGFIFMTSPSHQCLKLFLDQTRTYDAAKAKCQAEGMVIAKPHDPIALRRYLITRYGSSAFCWIGARGDGTRFRWDRDNSAIETTSLYWRTSHPGTSVSSSYCIRLEALNSDWVADPERPYWRMSCTGFAYTLCELIME